MLAEMSRFMASEVVLDAVDIKDAADRELTHVLYDMGSVSQSHVWDSIDFYTRPASIEAAEIEAYELIEDETRWIERTDYICNWVIEDYYEGGAIWAL